MKANVFVASFVPLMIVSAAHAQVAWPSTGNDFLAMCETEEPLKRVFCTGYVVGIVGLLGDQRLICLPPSVTGKQLRYVALKYLRDNPKISHQASASLIGIALTDAFPCKN
jgi:hypothetical protein